MKCFYHNDLDGRCAGAIVRRFATNVFDYEDDEYYEVDYVMQLPLDGIKENEKVYFVDYSFKKDTLWQLEKVLEKTKDVIWIDHHTSSLNLEKEVPWLKEIKGIRRDKISGAALTYMYFNNCEFDDLPYYIKLVSDYDCWIYKFDPDTTYFKLGVESKEFDVCDDIWIDLSDGLFAESNLDKIIETGKTIKQYIDQDNNYYREHFAYESEIEGHKCLVVNKKSNSWIFGEKYNEYPLVMVWVFNGTKFTYSIFSSNPNIDCSKIAEKFGGGGHYSAAGFSSEELLFKKEAK